MKITLLIISFVLIGIGFLSLNNSELDTQNPPPQDTEMMDGVGVTETTLGAGSVNNTNLPFSATWYIVAGLILQFLTIIIKIIEALAKYKKAGKEKEDDN